MILFMLTALKSFIFVEMMLTEQYPCLSIRKAWNHVVEHCYYLQGGLRELFVDLFAFRYTKFVKPIDKVLELSDN